MKELSIEEKAKAYDEAIKRAQDKMEEAKVFDYDDEQTAHTIRLTTTDIFPELAESEDERIRKEMISWLKGFIGEEEGCGYTEDEIRERIAWLEKQGEQKPYGQREECLDCQMNYAGECKGSCAMKRGEQKPADTEKGANGNEREIPNSTWSEEDESMLYGVMETEQYMLDVVNGIKKFDVGNDAIRKACTEELNWLKPLKDRVQPQPKQEWSEEDELHIKELESLVKRVWAIGEHENDKDTIHKMSDLSFFLKTLKPQLKQEWSEEDERLRNSCISHIEEELERIRNDKYGHSEIISDLKESCRERINWLKSLRPQNRWKPSDEQMEYLAKAITTLGNEGDNKTSAILYELRTDLKKLKG